VDISDWLLLAVDSTGRCNKLAKSLSRPDRHSQRSDPQIPRDVVARIAGVPDHHEPDTVNSRSGIGIRYSHLRRSGPDRRYRPEKVHR